MHSIHSTVFHPPLATVTVFQVHRGIKGIVKDEDGRGIKRATVSVKGIRHDILTGTTGAFCRKSM